MFISDNTYAGVFADAKFIWFYMVSSGISVPKGAVHRRPFHPVEFSWCPADVGRRNPEITRSCKRAKSWNLKYFQNFASSYLHGFSVLLSLLPLGSQFLGSLIAFPFAGNTPWHHSKSPWKCENQYFFIIFYTVFFIIYLLYFGCCSDKVFPAWRKTRLLTLKLKYYSLS